MKERERKRERERERERQRKRETEGEGEGEGAGEGEREGEGEDGAPRRHLQPNVRTSYRESRLVSTSASSTTRPSTPLGPIKAMLPVSSWSWSISADEVAWQKF